MLNYQRVLIPKSLDWSQNLKTFPHISPHFSRFQEILALPWRNRRNYLQRAAFPSPLRGGKSSGRPWNCRSVHFCTWHWVGCGLKPEELNLANHFIAVFINWDKYGITIPRTRLNIKNIVGHYQQCVWHDAAGYPFKSCVLQLIVLSDCIQNSVGWTDQYNSGTHLRLYVMETSCTIYRSFLPTFASIGDETSGNQFQYSTLPLLDQPLGFWMSLSELR